MKPRHQAITPVLKSRDVACRFIMRVCASHLVLQRPTDLYRGEMYKCFLIYRAQKKGGIKSRVRSLREISLLNSSLYIKGVPHGRLLREHKLTINW